MVLGLDFDATLHQRQHHLGTGFLQGVCGRYGKVSFLMADFIAGVLSAARFTPIPLAFDTVHMVIAFVLILIEAHIIENEELRLGSKIGDIGDFGGPHVAFCFSGNVARIFGIVFAGYRVLNITGHHQRIGHKGVHKGGIRLRHNQHVAFVNCFPATHRGAIETKTIFETLLYQYLSRNCEMFLGTGEIHKP